MSKFLKATAGMTPGEWRNGGSFTIMDSRPRRVAEICGQVDGKAVDLLQMNANAVALTAACELPELYQLAARALGIRHPNSGKWTKAETQRSWDEWDKEARALLARLDRVADESTPVGGLAKEQATPLDAIPEGGE